MFVACGIWCLADVSSVSPSSEQTVHFYSLVCSPPVIPPSVNQCQLVADFAAESKDQPRLLS